MTSILDTLSPAGKAWFAAVAAALATLSGILVGDTTLAEITQGQWLIVALAFFGSGGGTYAVPNREPTVGRHRAK